MADLAQLTLWAGRQADEPTTTADGLTAWSWVAIAILVVAVVVLALLIRRQLAARRSEQGRWEDEAERALDQGRRLVDTALALAGPGQVTEPSGSVWRSHALDLAALEHRLEVLTATASDPLGANRTRQVADAVGVVRVALDEELGLAAPGARAGGMSPRMTDAYGRLRAALDAAESPDES